MSLFYEPLLNNQCSKIEKLIQHSIIAPNLYPFMVGLGEDGARWCGKRKRGRSFLMYEIDGK